MPPGRVIGEDQAKTDLVNRRKYPLSLRRCYLGHTQDFLEGRKAEAEGRKPVYQGK